MRGELRWWLSTTAGANTAGQGGTCPASSSPGLRFSLARPARLKLRTFCRNGCWRVGRPGGESSRHSSLVTWKCLARGVIVLLSCSRRWERVAATRSLLECLKKVPWCHNEDRISYAGGNSPQPGFLGFPPSRWRQSYEC